MKVEKP
jgi:hypothetical protein